METIEIIKEAEPLEERLMAEVKLLESGDAYWPDTVDAIELAAREIKRLRAALAESCAEERSQIWEAVPGGGCARALEAEVRSERMREALEQLLDDMGSDGHCVCEDAKRMAIAALKPNDEVQPRR